MFINSGFNASEVFRILDLNPSTYYHRMSNLDKERAYDGGRPVPGYSLNVNGRKVCDGQIEEYIMELIEGEAFGYGYYKIYKLLRRKHHLIINPNPKETGLIIRSDNGPQFISHVFEEYCNTVGIEHERIPINTPNKSARI